MQKMGGKPKVIGFGSKELQHQRQIVMFWMYLQNMSNSKREKSS